ncbi:MAG TPA: hypothetical protein VIS94_04780 [Desulfomonilia bacterium]|jgi:hypothetical protein
MKCKLLSIAVLAAGFVCWSRLSDSKKRFYKDLIRQVPYIIPRYFV